MAKIQTAATQCYTLAVEKLIAWVKGKEAEDDR